MSSAATSLPAIAEILPHRGRAALLDRVERHGADETLCAVEIVGSTWLHRAEGSVPSWVGIEYMAQCIAAHEGCLAHSEGRMLPPGFLVRARRVRLHRASFRPGEILCVSARRLRGRPRLGAMTYACRVRIGASGGELAIDAELTVAVGRSADEEK